jgi:hypothetical protein
MLKPVRDNQSIATSASFCAATPAVSQGSPRCAGPHPASAGEPPLGVPAHPRNRRRRAPARWRRGHEGFTAHDLCWIAGKSVPKLEDHIGSDRVEVVITVDKVCQAPPNDVKERIERGKRSIGRVVHRSIPLFGNPASGGVSAQATLDRAPRGTRAAGSGDRA